jgi:hypothetical protein
MTWRALSISPSEQVMAQDGQYSDCGADALWGGAFFGDDNEDEIDYF